jgi:hypothetical protein
MTMVVVIFLMIMTLGAGCSPEPVSEPTEKLLERVPENVTTQTQDLTPRIAFWYGKVNQHVDGGFWKTDLDGRSGANSDPLTYCRKFYPQTVRVEAYPGEQINSWCNGGNTDCHQESGPRAESTYKCVF